MQSNVKDNVVFASPKSEEERALVAGACVRKLGIEIPAVLDEFGNSTEQAYRRSDALEQRRMLMAAWAAHCEHQGGAVVPLRRAR